MLSPPILTKFDNSFKSMNPAIIALPIPDKPIAKDGASCY